MKSKEHTRVYQCCSDSDKLEIVKFDTSPIQFWLFLAPFLQNSMLTRFLLADMATRFADAAPLRRKQIRYKKLEY